MVVLQAEQRLSVMVLQQGSKVLGQLQAEAATVKSEPAAGRSSRSLFGSSTVQASGGDSRSSIELGLSIDQ